MASPVCQVSNNGGAYAPTTNGNDVTPGATVAIQLVSTAGVKSWAISVIGTDELLAAAAINAALTVDGVNKIATFTAPVAGSALICLSTVTDNNGAVSSTTLGIFTPISGRRCGAVGEMFEGNAAFGWTAKFNPLLRSPAAAPAGTGVVSASGGSFATSAVVSINEAGQELDIVTANQSSVLRATNYAGSANGANFVLQHARGTVGAPAAVASGDQLGGVYGGGYYTDAGGGFGAARGGLRVVATEAFSSTTQGASVAVVSVPVGTVTAREVARFNADGTTQLYNPAGTFYYSLAAGALAANQTLNLPVLTATDTVAVLALAQTLTNKTIVAASNTITDTSATTGDILRHNGTKFVRLARGTANQVLTTNSGATDIGWAAGGGVAGTNQQVQFNDSGALNGDSGLLFDKSTGTLYPFNLRFTNQLSGPVNGYIDNSTLQTGDLLQIVQSLNADFSNSTTAFANTNLSFAMQANEVWDIEWDGTLLSGAATGGILLAVSGPSGAAVTGYSFGSGTTLAVYNAEKITALSASAVGYANASSVNGIFRVTVTVTNGATAGNAALCMKSGTAATAMKVLAGSKMKARRSVKV